LASCPVDERPQRHIWALDNVIDVLVISSTAYNEIASEPTIVVVPLFGDELDTGIPVRASPTAASIYKHSPR
jgi:hypothetical protein